MIANRYLRVESGSTVPQLRGHIDTAIVPVENGRQFVLVSQADWQEIGELMGWAKYRLSADSELTEGSKPKR